MAVVDGAAGGDLDQQVGCVVVAAKGVDEGDVLGDVRIGSGDQGEGRAHGEAGESDTVGIDEFLPA